MTAPRGPGPPGDGRPGAGRPDALGDVVGTATGDEAAPPGERPDVVEVDVDPAPGTASSAPRTIGSGTSGDGTAGRGTSGDGTSGRGLSGDGTSGRRASGGETSGGQTSGRETIGAAGDPSRGRLGERVSLWVLAHRRGVRVAAVLLTVLALAGAGLAVADSLTGPPLPRLVSAQVIPPPPDQSPLPAWSARADGRPSTPVNVTVETRLTFLGSPPDGVQVLGPDGPGIVRVTGPVGALRRVPARAEDAPVTLGADLDCTRVRFPVRTADYGLRVLVRDGRRVSAGVLHPDAITTRLARLVEASCGPWLARQYLTVTAARVRFTPAQPWSDLDLTVTNSGAYPARLESWGGDSGIDITAPGNRPDGDVSQVPLPARSTTELHLHLTATGCDGITSALSTGSGDVSAGHGPWSTGELLELSSDVAPARPQDSPPAYGEGVGPTGILIAPAAVAAVTAAVSHLCADLHPVVITVDDLRANGDRLTLSVTVYLDPGRVRSVDLIPDPAPADSPFTPLWPARHGLTPDRTGQLVVDLDYRAPNRGICAGRELAMPPFTIRALVPVPGGTRTVTFTGFAFLQGNPGAVAQLCR